MVVRFWEVELVVWPLEDSDEKGKCYDEEDRRYAEHGVGVLSEGSLQLEWEARFHALLHADALAVQAIVRWWHCDHGLQYEVEAQEHGSKEEVVC